MSQKVLFDCDNTMGFQGRDIDDGLTFVYLLGSSRVDLLGVTTTFGNSSLDQVWRATNQLFKELGVSNIPLVKGVGKEEKHKVFGEAAYFMAETVRQYPGEVTILATGSLTNVYHASLIDEDFYRNVKQIVVIGGILEPLFLNGKELKELNFSIDPTAAYHVLRLKTDIHVITGNLCLQSLFGQEQINALINFQNTWISTYLLKHIVKWIDHLDMEFDLCMVSIVGTQLPLFI
ncbi:nucleoside hydrolase [Radiobacillus deserti]|uniref:nucleoside hydrolase n=1 Tax=Radiobacillus deserti TaxID=2594883 RepID=UPI001315828A|nr:nucleoside hydrolase [Radiobacillus deserti]